MTACVLWFLAGVVFACLTAAGVVWLFLRAAESGDAELVDRNG